MVSRDGVLVGVSWVIFTLLMAILTVAILDPSTSLNFIRPLIGHKLILFSVLIAVAVFEYRLSKSETEEKMSSLSRTFVTILTFGVLFSLLFSLSIDLAQVYSLNVSSVAHDLSAMFFITSIYFILTLLAVFFHSLLIEPW